MRRLFSCALLCLAFGAAHSQTLDELEAKAKAKPGDFELILAAEPAMREGVQKLVDGDALRTAEDFRRAGMLQMGANRYQEPTIAASYQLLLTAAVMGDKEAGKHLGMVWDNLMMATGRYRRIGALKMPFRTSRGDQWWLNPAPEVIRKIYLAPEEAAKAAADAKDNPEVKQLVDADQKARQVDWGHLTAAQMNKIGQEDRDRFHRITVIIDEGRLKTAQDFENAALVCQHGEVFLDYALAHELCACAVLLGSKTASWLAGASYDRMLLSASYLQAFDTQFQGNWHIREFTTVGINDRMRMAVVHLTLAQSQDREKHPPKG